MRPGEDEAVLDLLEAAFQERAMFARYMAVASLVGPDDTWLALDGSRPVASVQVFDKRIRLRGDLVTIGGIGSVATHPEYERRGLSTALLRLAIENMQQRGHALSLLFTGRISFYERLDWIQIQKPRWSIRRRDGAPPPDAASRAFRPDDLPRIERLYDYYNLRLDSSVARDRHYWTDQLRYAGNPDERFRVVERDGKILAYARHVELYGIPNVMEHGRAPQGADALAALLCELAPETGAMLAHRTADLALTDALRVRDVEVTPIDWGDAMWRVLDRPRLLKLADAPETTPDAALLDALVGREAAVYWTSDRF